MLTEAQINRISREIIGAAMRIGDRDKRQVQTYLDISGYPLGLILNFGAMRLIDGIKRVVNNFPQGTKPLCNDTFLIR